MPVYDQTQSLGHLTGLSGRLFNTLLTRRFSAAGIEMTAEQWGVILLLLNHGAVTQGQLAEMLYLEKSTVSRSVTSLEKRGWVVREKGAEDGRHKRVALTENATGVAERCAEIARSVLEDAQAGLNPEAIASSHEQLSGVIRNLRSLNER
ncbi:MAG: MarR family transcriptional regulator [Rhodocyclaceae bacterium]|nr:MAG: MarR family transcriptional regulator [Rhodocyclaceae bacterium]